MRPPAAGGVDVGDRVAVETMLACRLLHPLSRPARYHLCRLPPRIYSYIPLSEPPGLWGSYAAVPVPRPELCRTPRSTESLPASIGGAVQSARCGLPLGGRDSQTRARRHGVDPRPGQRGLASVLACREAGADADHRDGARRRRRASSRWRASSEPTTRIDVAERERQASASASSPTARRRRGGRRLLLCDRAGRRIGPRLRPRREAPWCWPGSRASSPSPTSSPTRWSQGDHDPRARSGSRRLGLHEAPSGCSSRARYPVEKMHTHDFGLRDAELAIKTLARQIPGEESIHSCLIPGRD